MEKDLLVWFTRERDHINGIDGIGNNRSINGIDIKLAALEIHKRLYRGNISDNKNGFSASDGWLYGWLDRHNKTLRRVTTSGRDLPADYLEVIASFLTESIKQVRLLDLNRARVFNMDETSIYLDCPSRYTFADRGAKRVKVDTNGGEMVRISAAFTASACGLKLPILLILPRCKELENYIPPDNIRIIYKTTATFTEETISDYLETIMCNRRGSILYLDSARCHLTTSVKDKFSQLSLKRFIIPPRMTNILQPADVCWFANIKKAYCAKWVQWQRDVPKTFTCHGNSKSPGYALAIQWLSDIWSEFDESIIINSFDYCGITSQNNLHKTLRNLVDKNLVFNFYVDDLDEVEDIMGFDTVDQDDENLEEVLNYNHNDDVNEEISSPRDSLLLTQIPSFQPVMVLDSVIQETGSVGSINGGGGILYVQPSTSGITVLSNNSISNSSVTPYPNFVHPTSSASTIAFVPQNQSNLNHNTPVTSNDAQRNKQLIGRFVLNELAMNTQLNNVQYINKKNKEKKSAPKSNSTGNDGVT
ncbi:pogo transposable element with KRAB domain-like, partial [Brachionus plicatilis]